MMVKLLLILVLVNCMMFVRVTNGLVQGGDQACQADVVFVLDGSGSVGSDNWQLVLNFVNSFAEQFAFGPSENRIGVVDYGDDAYVQISLEGPSSLGAFQAAVNAIPYRDESTNTASGIRAARTMVFGNTGDREDVPNMMIIVTDGVPTREVAQTQPEADMARAAGIDVFTIGIGNDIDEAGLLALANNRRDHFFMVEDFSLLLGTLMEVVQAACYVPPQPVQQCDNLDLVLMLDASGSIGELNFTRVRTFAKDLLDQLMVDSASQQVAAVSFSSEAYLDFNLDAYTSLADMKSALDLIAWRDEWTHTSAALRTVRESVLETAANREDSRNLVLAVTDGYSNVDAENTIREASNIKDFYQDTRIMSVGVGDKLRMSELREMASAPGDHYMRLFDDYADLLAQVATVVEAICTVYQDVQPEVDVATYYSDVVFMLTNVDGVQENWDSMTSWLAAELLSYESELASYQLSVVVPSSDGVNVVVGPHASSAAATSADLLQDLDMPSTVTMLADALSNTAQLFSHPSDRADVANKLVIVTGPVLASEAALLQTQIELASQDEISVFVVCPDMTRALIYDTWFMGNLGSQPLTYHNFPLGTFDDLEGFHIMPAIAFESVPIVWGCDFEVTMSDGSIQPSFCDMTQSDTDDFDWTLQTGPTPSDNTGPITGAISGQYYAFIEASDREKADCADLVSPLLASGTYCLSFMYSMRGFHICSLDIVRVRSGAQRLMWHLHGQQGEEWQYAAFDIVLEPDDRVMVRADRGDEYSGDIAIDALALRSSPCAFQIP